MLEPLSTLQEQEALLQKRISDLTCELERLERDLQLVKSSIAEQLLQDDLIKGDQLMKVLEAADLDEN